MSKEIAAALDRLRAEKAALEAQYEALAAAVAVLDRKIAAARAG